MPSESQKPPRGATTPDFPVTAAPQLPSADYSYTVELVGSINHELGMLTEAVQGLKEHSKEQSKKLDDLRLDVHGAKMAGKTLLWIVGAVGALLGVILAAYFRQLFSH